MTGDDTFQEAMEFPDVMEEESGCSFHCDRCVHWNEVYSFGDSIHDRCYAVQNFRQIK